MAQQQARQRIDALAAIKTMNNVWCSSNVDVAAARATID
jgi:hypothetical protein